MARKDGYRHSAPHQRGVERTPKTTRCPDTGKQRYPSGDAAVTALHKAHRARHWAALDESDTRRHECRHYYCKACRGWHTTSLEVWWRKAA